MRRCLVACLAATAVVALFAAPAAYADNCAGLTDCSASVKIALLLLAILATAIALYVFFEVLGPMLLSTLVRGAAAEAAGAAGVRTAATAAAEREALGLGIRAELSGLNPTGCPTHCWNVAQAADQILGGVAAEAPLPSYGANLAIVEGGYGSGFQAATVGQIEGQVAGQVGARGLVAVEWTNGTGHVFNVINRGGEVFWIDAQAAGVRVSTSVYQTLGTGARNIVNSWFLPTFP